IVDHEELSIDINTNIPDPLVHHPDRRQEINNFGSNCGQSIPTSASGPNPVS
ncbi:hypothetical protein L195_g060702, partial [Trifolium pratense]